MNTRAGVDAPVLDRRALNRALLARQLLLERVSMDVRDAVAHLVGLQGQEPLQPYYGLWSRLVDFQPESLAELLLQRAVVRAPLMRTTVHLVTAEDALAIYPLVRPVLTRTLRSTPFGKGTAGVDLDALCAHGRALLEEQPRTMKELGQLLHERWPDYEPKNLAYAIHYLLPVLQITPRGVWGQRQQATWTTFEHWLGRPLDPAPSIDDLVLRYLAAFGPASSADIRTWSGITGLREVIERLRPQLVSYRDERGRELFDIHGAPLPDPETPAPPRFLPQFDNAFLSHDDRSRIVSDEHRKTLVTPNGRGMHLYLVDGFVAGTWDVEETKTAAALMLKPLVPLSPADRREVEEEAARMLVFLVPGKDHDVRFVEGW